MDNYTSLQKKAAAQRRQYVLDKLASIIPNAVNDRNAKIKQRKQAVQVKVASIVERVTNPEQRKQTVQTKVAAIVQNVKTQKASDCCKAQTMPRKDDKQQAPWKGPESKWKSIKDKVLPKPEDKKQPKKDSPLPKFPLPKKS